MTPITREGHAKENAWAKMRADDAGRLARELVACRLQSQAAIAAAYEAAAQVCDSGNAGAFWGKAIRAIATTDQIAALAAVRAADQAEIELLLKNHNGMSAEITRLRAVIAKDAAQMIDDQHKLDKAVEALRYVADSHPGACTDTNGVVAKARAVLAEIGGA